MANFKKLAVWRQAVALGDSIYHATRAFPDTEKYGLTAQLRRAAVSLTSNIAEGCGRGTDRELAQFLRIARGSVNEIESQLYFARRQGFIEAEEWSLLDAEAQRISGMLKSLIVALSQTPKQ